MDNPLMMRLLEKSTHLRQPTFITFTMIHPTDRKRRVPSRHVPSCNINEIYKTLDLIRESNAKGWGAYVGIAYRKSQLPRYQRGGKEDILALPAIFADVDRDPNTVLPMLDSVPRPSIIVASGGGTHLYWMLETPTTDIDHAEAIIRGMALWLKADSSMTGDQIMRLPGSRNTKPQRNNASCEVLQYTSHEYHLDDFFGYELLTQTIQRTQRRTRNHSHRYQHNNNAQSDGLNLSLSDAVLYELERHYAATAKGDGWYACYCPFNHRKDRFPGDHAYYRPDIGLFNCFGKHGQLLNHELATHLRLNVNDYGGIYK
jgi:hypothetical protein